MKHILSPSGHSHVRVRRVRDSLHGDMLEIQTANTEVGTKQETRLSLDQAERLAQIIQDAVLWLKEPPP